MRFLSSAALRLAEYDADGNLTHDTDLSYSYDVAGNNVSVFSSMSNQRTISPSFDGDGRMVKRVETQWSTTTSVPYLNASFLLSYDYNLAGELKKITDSTNTTINYNYDSAGRIGSVTGENNLYGGVSQYASNLTYRAWSGIKSLTYGNNYTLSVAYNSRLQGTLFEVAGQPSQYGPSTVMKTSYQYYANGSLKYAQDQLDERFDRAYGYDHRGMLLGAYTGSEARDYINGTSNSTQTVPYRQSYQYDAFGNMTSRDASFWSHSDSFSATYTNHRRTGFFYDADGRLTQDDDLQYHHDAAGRSAAVVDADTNKWLAYGRDGDGQLVKRVETVVNPILTTYYLHSTVLGRVVTELNQSGVKQKGYVFAGDQVLAEQENNVVTWKYTNPLTGSRGGAGVNGQFKREAERDPMGVNVALADLFLEPLAQPQPEPFQPMLTGDESSCGSNPNCTRCYLDGMEIGCDRAMHLMDIGAADLQVTLNDGRRVTVPVQSFGLGIFRVWIGSYDPRGPGYDSSPDDDVVRVNAFQDDLIGHWETFTFNFTPQNSDRRRHHPEPQKPTMVAIGGTDKLKTLLEQMLSNEKCRSAIQRLINDIANQTGIEATATDPLDLFSALTSQTKGGGVYVDVPRQSINDYIPKDARIKDAGGGSGLSWTFISSKSFQRISVVFAKYDDSGKPKEIQRLMFGYLITAIHEITHVAPKHPGKFYDHPEMDKAAMALGAKGFDDYIEKHCIPSQYWSRP